MKQKFMQHEFFFRAARNFFSRCMNFLFLLQRKMFLAAVSVFRPA